MILRIVFFVFFISYSYGQQNNGVQVTFTHENDFLGLSNMDENYTGGASLEFVFPERNNKLPFPSFKDANNFNSLSLAGTAYTPQDLAASNIIIGDRPYASLTYIGVGKISVSKDSKKQFVSQLIIGLAGWKVPGEVQYYIHDHNWFGTTRPTPQGWKNQIGYNGKFVLNFSTYYTQQTDFKVVANENLELVNVLWTVGGDLGNYMINVKAGAIINLLNYNSYPILKSNEIHTITKSMIKEKNASISKKIRCYIFAEPKIGLVGYNSTLEGLLFNDDSAYTIDHSDVNRIFFELKAGMKFLFWDTIYLGYNHSLRTKEFNNGKNVHYWGGISMGYRPKSWSLK